MMWQTQTTIEYPFAIRPASIEEAGLFYSQMDEAEDAVLGTVGHIRMDFGASGKEFYHTWWPHNGDQFNTGEFKDELQKFVDMLRADGPLTNLASMRNYCYQHGGIMVIFIIIMMGYAIIKCFFSNLKRGGILLIQIAVGSLYMFSVPRGYMDGFVQWCKQIIGLCLTTFLQATILTAGLMVLKDHALLGLGLMLSAGEVPRICGAFGLDTSTRANIMSAVYAAQTAVNTTRTVVQTVGAAAK